MHIFSTVMQRRRSNCADIFGRQYFLIFLDFLSASQTNVLASKRTPFSQEMESAVVVVNNQDCFLKAIRMKAKRVTNLPTGHLSKIKNVVSSLLLRLSALVCHEILHFARFRTSSSLKENSFLIVGKISIRGSC